MGVENVLRNPNKNKTLNLTQNSIYRNNKWKNKIKYKLNVVKLFLGKRSFKLSRWLILLLLFLYFFFYYSKVFNSHSRTLCNRDIIYYFCIAMPLPENSSKPDPNFSHPSSYTSLVPSLFSLVPSLFSLTLSLAWSLFFVEAPLPSPDHSQLEPTVCKIS